MFFWFPFEAHQKEVRKNDTLIRAVEHPRSTPPPLRTTPPRTLQGAALAATAQLSQKRSTGRRGRLCPVELPGGWETGFYSCWRSFLGWCKGKPKENHHCWKSESLFCPYFDSYPNGPCLSLVLMIGAKVFWPTPGPLRVLLALSEGSLAREPKGPG